MAVQIPFPLPSHGYALNSKMRVNLDFLVNKFNEFNTGVATWDTVAIGIANNETGTLTFYNSSNANYLTIRPGVTASSVTYTLPTAIATNGLLQTDASGVTSWTLTPSITSATLATSLSIKNISSPTFTVNLKAHTNTATSFDFYFPETAGGNTQVLTSDGTKTYWSTLAPVTTALAGNYAIYSGGSLGASSSTIDDHFTFSSHAVRLAIASHTLAGDRTYTIPDSGANATILTDHLDISTIGDITNIGASSKSISSYTFKVYGASSGILTINANASTTSHTIKFPATQGAANTALTNDGSGNLTWTLPTAATAATRALDNLASVAINAALIGDTDNTYNFGSSSIQWKDVYAVTGNFGKSGRAGSITLYPATASKGHITIAPVNQAGDTEILISNAAMTAARAITIPDAGTTNSNFVLSEGTATINGAKTFADLRGTFGDDIAAGSHKITGLSAGAANGDSIRYEQIFGFRILQIVSATDGTGHASSSGTFADTSLTASITPSSSSSKILVFVSQSCEADNGCGVQLQLVRGTSTVLYGPYAMFYNGTASDIEANVPIMYLDSPATTSSTTYKTQFARAGGAGTARVNNNAVTTRSEIYLFEIG